MIFDLNVFFFACLLACLLACLYSYTELNGIKWRNENVFIASHEREKGGMLGSKNDNRVLFSNISLLDFLRTTMNPNSYFYWTGGISDWEKQIEGFEGESESIDLAEGRGIFQIRDDSNPEPAIHLTHPGVIEHTNFNTLDCFLIQVMGGRRVLVFNYSTNLYPYPNIHRSYSYSQVPLEEGGDVSPFSDFEDYRPYEVHLQPGDVLFVPAYWFHRLESSTMSLSMAIYSSSAIEAGLSDIYWRKLPLDVAKTEQSRLAVVEIYLRLLITGCCNLVDESVEENEFRQFIWELYRTRYKPLYPRNYFEGCIICIA